MIQRNRQPRGLGRGFGLERPRLVPHLTQMSGGVCLPPWGRCGGGTSPSRPHSPCSPTVPRHGCDTREAEGLSGAAPGILEAQPGPQWPLLVTGLKEIPGGPRGVGPFPTFRSRCRLVTQPYSRLLGPEQQDRPPTDQSQRSVRPSTPHCAPTQTVFPLPLPYQLTYEPLSPTLRRCCLDPGSSATPAGLRGVGPVNTAQTSQAGQAWSGQDRVVDAPPWSPRNHKGPRTPPQHSPATSQPSLSGGVPPLCPYTQARSHRALPPAASPPLPTEPEMGNPGGGGKGREPA